MLCFELEGKCCLADLTFKAVPVVAAHVRALNFLHLGVEPVSQAIQMDEFHTSTTLTTLKQWIIVVIGRIPAKSAIYTLRLLIAVAFIFIPDCINIDIR